MGCTYTTKGNKNGLAVASAKANKEEDTKAKRKKGIPSRGRSLLARPRSVPVSHPRCAPFQQQTHRHNRTPHSMLFSPVRYISLFSLVLHQHHRHHHRRSHCPAVHPQPHGQQPPPSAEHQPNRSQTGSAKPPKVRYRSSRPYGSSPSSRRRLPPPRKEPSCPGDSTHRPSSATHPSCAAPSG